MAILKYSTIKEYTYDINDSKYNCFCKFCSDFDLEEEDDEFIDDWYDGGDTIMYYMECKLDKIDGLYDVRHYYNEYTDVERIEIIQFE